MSDAATRLELITRLNQLESAQANEQVMEAFRSSLNQVESVLGDQAKDVEAATGKIDQVKESIDKFKDVVEHAKGLLETNGLDGVIDGASQTSDAYGQISEGVGKLGSKSKEVAETISKLSDKLDKIAELKAMGGDQADVLISEFGEMIGGLTDLLGPLIDAVPVIGPFLDMYAQAIEGISKSVGSIISSMRSHNLAARQAGLDDVYKFTVSGATARQQEIDEITAKLDEMGWYEPPEAGPAQPTQEEIRVAGDVDNAFKLGLDTCGCGDGASSPQAGWRDANRRLQRARQRLALATQRAADVEWMTRDMDRLQRESADADAKLETARESARAAGERVETEAAAGHSSGTEITNALADQRAADTALTEAETAATRASEPLDRYESARDDLVKAQVEYNGAYRFVKKCFDKMYAELPAGEYFDVSRTALTTAHSPDGWFEKNYAPGAKALLGRLGPIPKKPVRKKKAAAKKAPARKAPAKKVAAKKVARKKAVAKKASAVSVAAGEPDEGSDKRKLGMMVAGAVVVVLLLILFFGVFGGDDDNTEVAATTTAAAVLEAPVESAAIDEEDSSVEAPPESAAIEPDETTSTTSPPTTSTTEPEPTLDELLPPELRAIGTILQAAGLTNDEIATAISLAAADGLLDWIYSQSATPAGNGGPDVDLTLNDGFETPANDAQRLALFDNTVFPCGESSNGMTTVCDANFEPGTIGPDGIVVLITAFDGPVASEQWNYVYSAVFDSDGDPGNNFQASASFDWDQYQGTDRWWVLDVVGGVPELGRFDGSFAVPVQTGARAVIGDNAIVWFVPRVELGANPSWRATSFRHDGSFDPSVSAGDVTGANPTEALLAIEPRTVTLTEEG